MGNALYIEPFAGIAGDMLLSALAGLADAYDDLLSLPERIHLPDGRIELVELNKNGIACTHVRISEVTTGETFSHDHVHPNSDHHHHHHGPHRHLSDILTLIDAGHIPDGAKAIAKRIFTLIGEAESRIHNIPIDGIHFHEVSGVDSILDIVGCAVLIDRLQIESCYCDPICVGFGQVKTQHGLLPVPAPATAELLLGMPTFKGDEQGERCTPTGAAILRFLNPSFKPPARPARRIAYGPGTKNFRSANVVRVSLLEPAPASASRETAHVIECNLDDISGELLGDAFQQGLLAAGALDFHLAPVFMKKGRPGYLLSALAKAETRDAVIEYILERTTTIGVRHYPVERAILERRNVEVASPMGTVLAKESIRPSGTVYRKYEHDSLNEIARQQNLTVIELLRRLPQR